MACFSHRPLKRHDVILHHGYITEKWISGDMLTAIVLIKAARDKINNVAQKLADIEGISEVYSVSGRYDLIAIVRVGANEELAKVVTRQMVLVNGIADTETLIAFRHYSRHDLEQMFAIGLEENQG